MIDEKCGLADCSVRVVVSGLKGSAQVLYRRGCNISFAQAAWTGSVVGLFLDGGTCGTARIAYDAVTGARLPFAKVEGAVREAIRGQYHVRDDELAQLGGDIFSWATYPGDGSQRRSREEFGRRYPH
jgi:hypothetical protein